MLRLTLALSVLVLVLAVAFDIKTLVPHTTVRVTSVDGRQATVHLQVPKAYIWADPKMVRMLIASEVSIANPTAAGGFGPDGVSADQIKDIVVLQGPDYWWWADSQLTGPAVLLVASLWLAFLVLRRVVRAIVS